MDILYVAAESANWVINLCNEFCAQGHNVTCIVQDLDEYDSANPVKHHENLTTFNIPFETFLNPERLLHVLDKHLEHGDFDIVFGSHAPVCPAVVVAGKNHDVPTGIMLLDIPSDLIAVTPMRQKQWGFWFDYLTQADIILVNTEVAGEEYGKFTNTEFDPKNVVTYAINQHLLFDNTGIDTKGDYVLSICRLTDMKNCILIPKAIKKLDLDMKYVAIGRNSGQLDEIQEFCNRNGIEFEHHEMVSELKKFELIEGCSMLIYPQKTPYIGGLSPFEAMYVGKPAVVPELKVLRDLYGDHALYFNNDDPDDLGLVIHDVHSKDRASLRETLVEAHDYAVERANFKTMAKELLERMKTVIK